MGMQTFYVTALCPAATGLHDRSADGSCGTFMPYMYKWPAKLGKKALHARC
jgi:hypothetical protein